MDILLKLLKTSNHYCFGYFCGISCNEKQTCKIITGTIISFVGFSMIKLGSSILAETLTAFSKLFNSAFHLTGVVPSNEAMMAMTLDTLGTNAAIILILGLVINILMARFTRFKAVYLSLHLALFTAFALSAVFRIIGFSDLLTTPHWWDILRNIYGNFTKYFRLLLKRCRRFRRIHDCPFRNIILCPWFNSG